jgi:hypothetical protein
MEPAPILFFIWLFATFGASALIAWPLTAAHCRAERSRAYFLAALLCLHLLFICALSLALTFVKSNNPGTYLGTSFAFVLLAALCYPGRIGPAWRDIRLPVEVSGQSKARTVLTTTVLLLFLPPLLFNIAPITERDSLSPASAIIAFSRGSLSPNHIFLRGSSEFWEFSYLPSFVLSHTDRYYWISSLEAVCLFGICAYLIGVSLKLPRQLSILLTANAAAIYHFWYGSAGVMTMKVDMIFAAGVLLLVLAHLRTIRGEFGALTTVALVSGIAFTITKSTGPFVVASVLGIGGVIVYIAKRSVIKPFGGVLIVALPCAIAISGHLYLYNLLHYRNPFFPVDLRLFGLHLPGMVPGIQGTSILSHIREAALWRTMLFSGSHHLHYAGVLFPIELVSLFTLMFPVSVYGLQSLLRRRGGELEIVLIGLVTLSGWLLYFASPWSAGDKPMDFFYLSPMASLRYVLPFLFLADVWLVALFARWPKAIWLAYALIGVSFLSRIYILYFQLPPVSALSVSGILDGPCGRASEILSGVVGILCVSALVFRRPGVQRLVLCATAAGLLLATPRIVEANRKIWMLPWQPVTKAVAFANPSEVFAINELNDRRLEENLYIEGGVYGQHDVTFGSISDLKSRLRQQGKPPRFVVFAGFVDFSPPEVDRLSGMLAAMNYAPLAVGSWSATFEYAPVVRLSELGDAGRRTAAYCPREACLSSAPHGAGLEYVGVTGALYYTRDGRLRTIVGSDGDRGGIGGIGGQYPDGSWTGLPLTWNGSAWAIDRRHAWELMDVFTITRFFAGKPQQAGWSITGNIKHDSTSLEDKDGHFVRIRALETRPDGWLAVVYSGPQFMPERDFSLECELRNRSGQVYLQSFDFGPNGVIGSHSLPLSSAEGGWSQGILSYRFHRAAAGTYMAATIVGLKSGEFVDLRAARILKGRWFEGFQTKP